MIIIIQSYHDDHYVEATLQRGDQELVRGRGGVRKHGQFLELCQSPAPSCQQATYVTLNLGHQQRCLQQYLFNPISFFKYKKTISYITGAVKGEEWGLIIKKNVKKTKVRTCAKNVTTSWIFHGLRATHIVVSSGQSLPSSPEPLFFNEGNERIYCALNYFLSPSLPHPKILNAFLFCHVYPFNLQQ